MEQCLNPSACRCFAIFVSAHAVTSQLLLILVHACTFIHSSFITLPTGNYAYMVLIRPISVGLESRKATVVDRPI